MAENISFAVGLLKRMNKERLFVSVESSSDSMGVSAPPRRYFSALHADFHGKGLSRGRSQMILGNRQLNCSTEKDVGVACANEFDGDEDWTNLLRSMLSGPSKNVSAKIPALKFSIPSIKWAISVEVP